MKDVIASVIVPVYNSEETIGRCIDSLLDQTLRNIEIIVVDDGSTDNTSLVCYSYEDERLRFITQENGGVSKARNKGLDVARGKYILFCDSDDWVEKNFVESLCNEFKDLNVDLVVCGICLNDIQSGNVSAKSSKSFEKKVFDSSGFIELREKDLLAYPVNKAFKKDLIDKFSLSFDVNLSECEDLVFNLNYISKMENKMVVIPDILYHYEFRENSLSSKYHNDRFFDVIRPIFSAYEKIISKLNVKDVRFLQEIYTTYFLKIIENIPMLWDEKNSFSLLEKLTKVRGIVLSQEYSLCFERMDKSRFKKIALLIYGRRNWVLVLIFMKLFAWENKNG